METEVMGRVAVPVIIENEYDRYEVSQGRRKPEEIRRIEVPDALVDTGARMLSLPRRMIEQLGLQHTGTREATTAAGKIAFDIYGLVQLTIYDRQCPLDVAALPDDCPVLVGQIPLERLDFVVDPVNQRVIGNPAHGGKYMIEMY